MEASKDPRGSAATRAPKHGPDLRLCACRPAVTTAGLDAGHLGLGRCERECARRMSRDVAHRGHRRHGQQLRIRVGGLVYEIADVHDVGGRVALLKEFKNLDAPHRARRVLEVSADDCQTWESMLD